MQNNFRWFANGSKATLGLLTKRARLTFWFVRKYRRMPVWLPLDLKLHWRRKSDYDESKIEGSATPDGRPNG